MMILKLLDHSYHSNLSDLGQASMRKGLSHYLLQHFDPILPGHLPSFWLLIFLNLGFRGLVSSVNNYLTAELLSVRYEILSC